MAAAFLALAAHVAVDWFFREPRNYTRIEDGLWMGGHVKRPPSGTQTVLNLCELADRFHVENSRWEPIHDAAPAPSIDWLRTQVKFIESERAAGRNLYVHCINGTSRSGLVMAAYLMKREGWDREKALDYLRERRPAVNPNTAFMALLGEWETALKN